MSLRVGIDLVPTAAVSDSIETHGDRYLDRVFTPAELADCPEGLPRVAQLAARLAAKEATFKALRIGPEDPTVWREVEVRRCSTGSFRVSLAGNAARLAGSEGIAELSVTMSSGRDRAAAVVIAEVSSTHR